MGKTREMGSSVTHRLPIEELEPRVLDPMQVSHGHRDSTLEPAPGRPDRGG